MITVRKSEDRGHVQHGWLDTYHSFSFANYYDPEHMGFRSLRVINEDRIEGATGFGTHGHRDMEIITYVLEGALAHKDNMGNGSVMEPGDVQRMSAGTGVLHSEFNDSKTQACKLLQIWILPDHEGAAPGYEQKWFSPEDKRQKLCLIASREGREKSVKINQDVDLYATLLNEGSELKVTLRQDRHGWLQMVKGEVEIGGKVLKAGDAAKISDEREFKIKGLKNSEFLFFDLN